MVNEGELIRRLTRLEAIEEIRQLRYRYAINSDTRGDAENLRQIFTPDGVWDGGDRFGRHEGIERIIAHNYASKKEFSWKMHFLTCAVIEVDSECEEATGKWYLWEPSNIEGDEGPSASVVVGRYQDLYRVVGGEWRIAEVLFVPITVAPYPSWSLEGV